MGEFDELKRLAEAATPGPWVINDEDGIDEGGPHLMTADGYAIADFWGNDSSLGLKKNEENAAYIASANPATILALIARAESAEAELERLRSQEPVVVISSPEWDAMQKGEDACCSKFDREMDCSRTMPVLLYAEPKPPAHPGTTHCDNCGLTWLDDGLNPIGCPYCKKEQELMEERKRLDWALAHEAGFHASTLSWSDSTGAIEMRAVPVGALRETIDVLMQEVG